MMDENVQYVNPVKMGGRMKKNIIVLVLLFCPIFLISWSWGGKDQKIRDLETQVHIEKMQKSDAQKAKEIAQQEAKEAKSSFNLLVGMSVAAVLIALIAGIAMGSKSRNDAKKQKLSLNEKQ